MNITVIDYTELSSHLASINVPVPPRGPDRTKDHREQWIANRVIKTLAKNGYMQFPFSFEMDDRPDLRIRLVNEEIGVEITEMVPPQLAQVDAIANKMYPDTVIDRSLFGYGTKWSLKQIHDYLKAEGGLLGPAWLGDAVEREWANAVDQTIKTKTDKLNAQGFVLGDKNWLAAYASNPGPLLDVRKAVTYVTPLSQTVGVRTFDLILLLTDAKMVLLDQTSSSVVNVEPI